MNRSDTALLLMDPQHAILGGLPDAAPVIDRMGRAASVARAAGIEVLYVRVAFRDGYPEVSADNMRFSAIAASGPALTESDERSGFVGELAPQAGELVVTKRRISAFAGSDLDLVLRSRGIGHLVLTGVTTSGVVLSTVRQAADLDLRLTVLADACADPDEEVHRVLTEKVFPRQAEVVTTEAWAASLTADPASIG